MSTKMPEVQISKENGRLRGKCPLCPASSISPDDPTKGAIEQSGSIRAAFDRHLMKAHPGIASSTQKSREDFEQSIARLPEF
jgi:hypothetical protein